MARGVNKVILIGNLGADPETRYTPNGNAVTNIRLATSEIWNDKQTGQRQERTEWHRVVCFGKLAEICQQYLRKGSQIYIEGSLRTNKWQDKEGVDRYTTEIIASEMHMIGGRPNDGGSNYQSTYQSGGYQGGHNSYNNSNNYDNARKTTQPVPTNQGNSFENNYDSFDDDVPF